MGEGFELVIWGVFIAIIWLRGLAKQAKRAKEREALEGAEGDERLLGAEATSGPPAAKARPSLRDQWADMARQIERQVQAQREAGQETLVDHDEDEERTIVIPGRRVIPAAPPERSRDPRSTAVARRSRSELEAEREARTLARRSAAISRPDRRPDDVRPARTKRRRVRQDSTGLLDRLAPYSPIQQAMILSELLGPPRSTKGEQTRD